MEELRTWLQPVCDVQEQGRWSLSETTQTRIRIITVATFNKRFAATKQILAVIVSFWSLSFVFMGSFTKPLAPVRANIDPGCTNILTSFAGVLSGFST